MHLIQNLADFQHLKIDVGLARRVGVDRHQIVGAVYLHTVTGVVEKRDIGSLNLLAETLYDLVQRRLVEVELRAATDQREAKFGECFGHQPGVVTGIVEARHVLIGGVADHKRHAPLRCRRIGPRQRKQDDQSRNDPCFAFDDRLAHSQCFLPGRACKLDVTTDCGQINSYQMSRKVRGIILANLQEPACEAIR